jgi:hypothetical protein
MDVLPVGERGKCAACLMPSPASCRPTANNLMTMCDSLHAIVASFELRDDSNHSIVQRPAAIRKEHSASVSYTPQNPRSSGARPAGILKFG